MMWIILFELSYIYTHGGRIPDVKLPSLYFYYLLVSMLASTCDISELFGCTTLHKVLRRDSKGRQSVEMDVRVSVVSLGEAQLVFAHMMRRKSATNICKQIMCTHTQGRPDHGLVSLDSWLFARTTCSLSRSCWL